MQAITGCQSTLSNKIDTLQLEICLIRKEFDKVRHCLTEAEHQLGDTEDMVRDHSAHLKTLQVKVKHLKSRTEDAENRNRRNNLRIIGLPEGSDTQSGCSTRSSARHLSHPFLLWKGPTGCCLPEALLGHRLALLFFGY